MEKTRTKKGGGKSVKPERREFELPIPYKVDGITFIVTPVFKDAPSETITSILLNLMLLDAGDA